MTDKAIETLKKLYTLWNDERTPQAERDRACEQICKRLEKYGLDWGIFDSSLTQEYTFTYQTSRDRKLLAQCVYKVLCKNDYVWYGRHRKRERIIELTPQDHADIDTLYTFYRALWKQECEKLFDSFIQVHNLFGYTDEPKRITTEDEWLEETMRQGAFQEVDDPLAVRQLESGRR